MPKPLSDQRLEFLLDSSQPTCTLFVEYSPEWLAQGKGHGILHSASDVTPGSEAVEVQSHGERRVARGVAAFTVYQWRIVIEDKNQGPSLLRRPCPDFVKDSV
jgi:hypothetical protein